MSKAVAMLATLQTGAEQDNRVDTIRQPLVALFAMRFLELCDLSGCQSKVVHVKNPDHLSGKSITDFTKSNNTNL